MPFLTEPEPPRAMAVPVAPGIVRVVAPNPGPMTYHGTNTYLIETDDGVTVLDPGPDDPAHTEAVLVAAAGRIARIMVSHGHRDHVGALPALRAATGAEVFAFAAGPDIDRVLGDGDAVGAWRALHTPGHAADHLAFARDDGVVFSADHVMSWSSSVVSPPDGDMTDYIASLRRMLARDDRLYLPGHGPPLPEPAAFVQALLDHRLSREQAIAAALGAAAVEPDGLVARIYGPIAPSLRAAATRNVLAHLLKLERDGRAVRRGAAWVGV